MYTSPGRADRLRLSSWMASARARECRRRRDRSPPALWVGEPTAEVLPSPAMPSSHHLHDSPPGELSQVAEGVFRDGMFEVVGPMQQVLAHTLERHLAICVRSAVTDHLDRAPTRAERTAARPGARLAPAFPREVVPASEPPRGRPQRHGPARTGHDFPEGTATVPSPASAMLR